MTEPKTIADGLRLQPKSASLGQLIQTDEVRLYISVVSGRGWAAAFGRSLAGLTMQLGWDRINRRMSQVSLTTAQQANIVVSRNDHIKDAIAKGFTHFLSLDDDMVFPNTVVDRMLAHDKAVVTVNYRKKSMDKIECVCGDESGEHISSEGKMGLEQVYSMGMGLTLINLQRIQHVPAPYFAVIWNKNQDHFIIEDGVFSALLREHFVEMWCDHDLSREVGHVGEVEFRLPPLPTLHVPQTQAA